jgi:hypothetical protein
MAIKMSIQDRIAVIDLWQKSKWFPAGLLETEHNFNVLSGALQQFDYLSISDIVAVVQQLGDIANGGKLQYAQKAPETITVTKIVERQKTRGELQEEKDIRKVKAGFHVQHKTAFDRDDERQEADRDKRSPQQKAIDGAKEQGQREAKAETLHIINSYVYENGNRVWRGITEARQKKLQAVITPKDWRASLDAVRAMRNAFKTDLPTALKDLKD